MTTMYPAPYHRLIAYVLLICQLLSSCGLNETILPNHQKQENSGQHISGQLEEIHPQVSTELSPSTFALSHGPYKTVNGEYAVALHQQEGRGRANVQNLWDAGISMGSMAVDIDPHIATYPRAVFTQRVRVYSIGLTGLLGAALGHPEMEAGGREELYAE